VNISVGTFENYLRGAFMYGSKERTIFVNPTEREEFMELLDQVGLPEGYVVKVATKGSIPLGMAFCVDTLTDLSDVLEVIPK
jgi:hypothetical protein